MTGVPLYPDALRNDVWQRNKGVVAKVFKGETGIGALLIELKRRYDAVHWGYFDPNMDTHDLPKPQTRHDLVARRQQANAHNGELEHVREQARLVQTKCNELAAKWKKSSVVPASTRKIVESMATAADHLAVALRSIGEEGYDKIEAEITRREKNANEMLDGWIQRLNARIPTVKEEPTVAKYKSTLHQQVRGLSTAMAQLPTYTAIYAQDQWKIKSGDGFMSGVKDGDPVKDKVEEIEAALQRFERFRQQQH